MGKRTQEGAEMAEKDSVKPAHGGAGYKRKGQKYKSLLKYVAHGRRKRRNEGESLPVASAVF